MLTTKDIEIVSFIQEFGAADAKQIYRLFFSQPDQGELCARQRLKQLVTTGNLQREKDKKTSKYIYFTKKNVSKKNLLVTEFYLKLYLGPGRIKDFENNFAIGNIRPSAYVTYLYQDQVYLLFLEIPQAQNSLNIRKYEKLFESGAWKLPAFPKIVIISDHWNCKLSNLNVAVIPTTFENWEKILD